MSNTLNTYQINAVMTANPQHLTLMLYDGAIKFCNLALEGIEKKDIEKSNNNILKAQRIIEELTVTLDTKYEVSKEMVLLYDYIMQLLVEANMRKDADKLLESKELIVQFRDLWKEVIKTAK